MHDSDMNSPWGDDEKPDESVFDKAPLPPLPTIPPPATATATLEPVAASPAGAPVLSGVYGETQPPVPDAPVGGGGRLAWIGAIVGALVLLVGGGFFGLTALNASGGAATPDEAVEKLIEAVNGEDVITLGELLEPGERRTIVDPTIDEILPELIRLGVLADDFDAGAVDGIDLELPDVTYRIDAVSGHDDLVHVVFTGGQAASSSQMSEFPFGESVFSRFGDSMRDEPPVTESIEESDNPLVLVKRNDRWYVSLWYSLGEAARLELGQSLPLVSEMPAPQGSPSPEVAVEQFVLDAFDLDLAGMLSRLDPEEAHALYRYAPLFLNDAQTATQDARRELEAEGVNWNISDMRLTVDRDGDDAVVDLEGFTFTLTTPDVDLRIEYGPDRLFGSLDGVIDGDDIFGTVEITPTLWRLQGSYGTETIDAEVRNDADTNTVTLSGRANGEPFTGSLTVDESGGGSE